MAEGHPPATAMAQGHPPAAAMASYKRSRLPFARPQTLQKSAQLRREKVPQRKSHHKATAMAEGHPPAAAMAIRASYRCSRLSFARPQRLQTLQRSAQLRREKVPQQAQHAPLPHAKATTRPQQWLKGTPTRATSAGKCHHKATAMALATPNAAGKSHHKATAMAQEHPTAAAMAFFIGVQGCRLPGLKPSKPSNSSKSLPNSAGKRYPNKPNTRHARRQKPPQGHSNGSRAPHGRSNGFL